MVLPALILLLTVALGSSGGANRAAAKGHAPTAQPLSEDSFFPVRPASVLALKTANGGETRVEIAAGPVVRDGVITLIPGESFVVQLVQQDGKFRVQKLTHETSGSGPIFKISFFQVLEAGRRPDMFLVVENAHHKRLKYRARIVQPGTGLVAPTSVCEVLPGITSYEHWPEPIQGIQLYDFQYLEGSSSTVVCE